MNQLPLSTQQLHELLQRMALFRGLGHTALQGLASGTRQVCALKDEAVFSKGDTVVDLHVVLAGQIRNFLPRSGGAEKVIGTASAGEALCMAETCLGIPFASTAVAAKKTNLLLLDRHALLREARTHGDLALRLIQELARLKLGLVSDLESCTPRSAAQKVACMLLQHRIEDQRSYEIRLPTTRRVIAAKLNMAQETLSRTFHQFANERLIEMHGPLVRVLDSERLLMLRTEACPKKTIDG